MSEGNQPLLGKAIHGSAERMGRWVLCLLGFHAGLREEGTGLPVPMRTHGAEKEALEEGVEEKVPHPQAHPSWPS